MSGFKAHSKPVYNLAFSPDGSLLLSSGGDKRVALWSLDSCRCQEEWAGSQLLAPVAFSPDGAYIGIGGYSVRVWRVGASDGAVVDSREWAESCAFSPDGQVFAAFGAERAIMRWAIPSGASLPGGWGGTRTANNSMRFPVGGMTFRPDGAVVANCYGVLQNDGYHSVIHLWEASSGVLFDTLPIGFKYDHPRILAYSPDGRLLAAETGTVLHIWDFELNREVAALYVCKKHYKGFAFTPDGRTLLAVNGERDLRRWDTATWSEAEPFDAGIGKLTAIAVSADGMVALGSASGNIRVLAA